LEIDVEVDINQLSEDLVEELEMLEPTGYMNPAPVLMSRNLYVMEHRTLKDRHLKFKVARAGRPPLDAIAFGLGETWGENMPRHVDVVYQLEINEWNGRRSLQLNVQDLRPAGMA